MKKNTKKIIITIFLIIISIMYMQVNAEGYKTQNERITQNNYMIQTANKLNKILIESYKDKSLKDLQETNMKGLTAPQQQKINELANNILGEEKNTLTDIQKIEKFYNWIVSNYYFYAYPNKISTLVDNRKYDNPYFLLVNEYEETGKIRARSNGYASMLIALSRSQNIPARTTEGYFNGNINEEDLSWNFAISKNAINTTWTQVYVNGSWIMLNPLADCKNKYNEINQEYENGNQNEENGSDNGENLNQNEYFNCSIEKFSATHVAFKTYIGSTSVEYISNTTERNKIIAFLNRYYGGKQNGKKINSSYNSSNSKTWFVNNDTVSKTNGYGNITVISWPSKKSLYGALDLSNLTKLEKVVITNNILTSVNMTNMQTLKHANLSTNKITKAVITGSNQMLWINLTANPLTYVEYDYNVNKRKAKIKTTTGGTISATYTKSNNKNIHKMWATAASGYTFTGWYNEKGKLITKKTTLLMENNANFTYTAKFTKKTVKATYVKVSISKQKLWYYKNSKLVLTTNVVTGKTPNYKTPTGTYKLLGKARNTYLVGPGYRSYVKYWMLIDRKTQIGLHDASWRSKFGGTIYKYNGSHGCVNLPRNAAKTLYNDLKVGTKVIIEK